MKLSVVLKRANQNDCYIYRHQPEVEALQEEINILNEQLDESKYEQDKQRRLIQTLKDVSKNIKI